MTPAYSGLSLVTGKVLIRLGDGQTYQMTETQSARNAMLGMDTPAAAPNHTEDTSKSMSVPEWYVFAG